MTAAVKKTEKATMAMHRALFWEQVATPLFSYRLFLAVPTGLSLPATPPASHELHINGDDWHMVCCVVVVSCVLYWGGVPVRNVTSSTSCSLITSWPRFQTTASTLCGPVTMDTFTKSSQLLPSTMFYCTSDGFDDTTHSASYLLATKNAYWYI